MAPNAASSSGTKPWVHHTDAVVAAALVMKGRAMVPAAASPREPPITRRLLSFLMAKFLPGLRVLLNSLAPPQADLRSRFQAPPIGRAVRPHKSLAAAQRPADYMPSTQNCHTSAATG